MKTKRKALSVIQPEATIASVSIERREGRLQKAEALVDEPTLERLLKLQHKACKARDPVEQAKRLTTFKVALVSTIEKKAWPVAVTRWLRDWAAQRGNRRLKRLLDRHATELLEM